MGVGLFRRRRRDAIAEWRKGLSNERAPRAEPDGFRHAPDAEPEDVVLPKREGPRGPITGLEGGSNTPPPYLGV